MSCSSTGDRVMTVFPHIMAFRRSERGAILVEFMLVFPLMLLFLAVIVEMTRMLSSYQKALAGVREATRYVSRTAPVDICVSGGSLNGYTTTLTSQVRNDISGTGVFAPLVTVNSVTPSHACVIGTYRVSPAPVATVTANVTITFPFGSLFSLFGSTIPSVTTNVADSARIIGS